MSRWLLSGVVVALALLALSLAGCGGGSTGTTAGSVDTEEAVAVPELPADLPVPKGVEVKSASGTGECPDDALDTKCWWDLMFYDWIHHTRIYIVFPYYVKFKYRHDGYWWYVEINGWPVTEYNGLINYRFNFGGTYLGFRAFPYIDWCNGSAQWIDRGPTRFRGSCYDPRGFECP